VLSPAEGPSRGHATAPKSEGGPVCNICEGTEFESYNGRTNARCVGCDSLERHRVCFEVYRREGVIGASERSRRAIHFAPERVTFDILSEVPGLSYMTADAAPDRYPHAGPMQLFLPQGLEQFDDGSFDYIIHNHVWEHIPGTWKDHVEPFRRVLKVGGKMIFTFPFSHKWSPEETQEGGEFLASDEERLRVFGQHDHVRLFGLDFPSAISEIDGIGLRLDGLSASEKAAIGDPGTVVFIMDRVS